MKKKIILSLATLVAVIAGITGMAAFEAHVINVTAKIENALSVMPNEIVFGTVFPQEYVEEELVISLSESFIGETRVDDVNYVIKQKPKVRPSDQNPDGDPYAIINPTGYPDGIVAHEYCLDNDPTDADDPTDPYYIHCYPVLCPFLSKHKASDDNTRLTDRCDAGYPFDCGFKAFHDMGETAIGHLVKSADDNVDKWVIDLAVPCFDGHCDQTYDDWVWRINSDVINPWDWTLPAGMEGEVFGCDLWIEVTGISESDGACTDNDNDGYYAEGGSCGEQDCDDNDPDVNPGATEICNDTIDNDCDGDIDCADSDCDGDPACQSGSDIVINEIMQNPAAVSDYLGEWFELYNTTDQPIELEGCVVSDDGSDSFTIIGSLSVPAYGYVVLAKNGDTNPNVNGGISPDYVYNSHMELTNTDDEIILTCNSVEMDRVEYDGGPGFPDPDGASMILNNPSSDNNVGGNWCTSTTSYGDGDKGTPGSLNDTCVIP